MKGYGHYLQLPDGSPRVEIVRLGDLKKDEYQRGHRSTYERVANHYDAGLYQVLEVSRRKNGDLYIVDGYQRYSGRIKRDGPDTLVLARVHEGLDVAGEVALFTLLNKERVRVNAYDILKAQRHAGEKHAIELFEMVEGLGLSLGKNYGKETIGSIAQLQQWQQQAEGLEILRRAILVAKFAWHGEEGSYHSIVISGLAYTMKWARDYKLDLWSKGKELNEFATTMSVNLKPKHVTTTAIGPQLAGAKTTVSRWAGLEFAATWNKGKHSAHRVFPKELWGPFD